MISVVHTELIWRHEGPWTGSAADRGREGVLVVEGTHHRRDLRLLEQGHLDRDEGWDDVTWWLFERP